MNILCAYVATIFGMRTISKMVTAVRLNNAYLQYSTKKIIFLVYLQSLPQPINYNQQQACKCLERISVTCKKP